MKDNELNKTKPIKMLNEITGTRSSRNEEDSSSRTERYKDAIEKLDNIEREEAAEEALAEKNIAMAEALLEVEEEANAPEVLEIDEAKAELVEETKKENVNVFDKLKDKWDGLSKKQKTVAIVVLALVIVLIVALIVFLIVKSDKKEEVVEPTVPVEEVAPVVVDNYYYKDGNLHFLNEKDEELGTYECKNKDSNLCYVSMNNNQDTFDVPKLVTDSGVEKSLRLPIYGDNYVFVYDNKTEGADEVILYSMNDKKNVATYTDVKAYDDNYVIVEAESGLYGLLQIDEEVDEVIEPEFLYLGMIDGQDNLIARTKKGYYVVNKEGKTESSAFSSSYEIKNYNKNYVVAVVAEEYNVYDYEGQLLDGGYDFATIKDDYIALVNGKKLYIKDKGNVKYNEEAIQLESKNYVKTYVYDENDRLSETKRSFDINVKDEVLEVTIYGGDEEITYATIDMLEIALNKQYEYINYFDGKLYVYKDAEKNELIGTYSCANKNYVTDEDKEYTTCFIANDTIFETNDMLESGTLDRKSRTPIINYKYVFIADGSENIVLYDLSSNKNLSSYSKVNTYTDNNDYKITTTSGEVEAIVLNKSGKYGMISINGSEVKTKYNFNYSKMERIGNNILVQETSGQWKVLFYNGTESVSFTKKITGYNSDTKYFKILDSGKYYVYDDEGNKVSDESYFYVELYSSYYAGLNDKRELSIYDYEGNKLTYDTALIGDYMMTNTANPAFKVKKDGDNFIVSVYDGTKYTEITLSTSPSSDNGSNTQGSQTPEVPEE